MQLTESVQQMREPVSIFGRCIKLSCDLPTGMITIFRMDGSLPIQMSEPSTGSYPIVDGQPIQDFTSFSCKVEHQTTGLLGFGERMTITSHSPSTGLERKVVYEVSDQEAGVIYTETSYCATERNVDIQAAVENEFTLVQPDGTVIWSYNGGGEGPLHYYDTLQEITLGKGESFFRDNKHNELAAGIPAADIYTANGGIAVGDASATRREVSTPVRETDSSAQVSVQRPCVTLAKGETRLCGQSFAIVHKGDFYNGLRGYKRAMEHLGLVMQDNIAQRSYELRWEGWGWQFEWTVDLIIGKLDELQAAGVKQITLDDGWYKNAGDWDLNPEKFPNGEADMHRLVDAIHAHGMTALLWWRPCDGGRQSVLYQEHPEYFIKQPDGTPISVLSAVGNPVGDSYALCPTSAGAIESTTTFIRRAMNDWGFDGFKGDYVWSLSKCYDPSHNHTSPAESTERQTDIYKAARETMVACDPDAFNLLCNCGAPQDYYALQYMTQVVTADPTSLDQTRRRVKAYKALMGDRFPVTTDHSAINNFITMDHTDVWYAAGVGTGAVLIEKFDFTGDEELEYERWLDIANREQLHKGRFVGDLYCYGFDPYETYAVEKDGTMYYAFYRDGIRFQPNGYPDIVLKGLDPNKMYRIVDYVNNRVVATNLMGDSAVFNTRFKNYLLVKAVEITQRDSEIVDKDWGFTVLKADSEDLAYNGNWQSEVQAEDKPVSATTSDEGSSVELSFAGTAIRWYGTREAVHSSMEVYLDGQMVESINTDAHIEENALLFERLDISAAIHTLKIVCKSGKASIVAIAFEPAIPEPVYEKVGALSDRIVYTGNWTAITNEVFYEGNAKTTEEVEASAEFSFYGTGIRWYGKRKLDFGIADVFIDGELADSVYSYGEPRFGQLLFEKTGLEEKEHTIRIVHRFRANDLEYLAYTAD